MAATYRGPVFGDETAADLLRQSTLLLMPGLVGLAVVDSFATGCPLVTVDLPFHSPEIEYLENGVNGVCLPAGTTPTAYAEAVVELLGDPRATRDPAGGLPRGGRDVHARRDGRALRRRPAAGAGVTST